MNTIYGTKSNLIMLVSLTHKFSYTHFSLDDPAVYKNFYVPERSFIYVTVSCWFLISLLHWPLFRGGGSAVRKLYCTVRPPPPPQAGKSERDVFTLTGSTWPIAAGLPHSLPTPNQLYHHTFLPALSFFLVARRHSLLDFLHYIHSYIHSFIHS